MSNSCAETSKQGLQTSTGRATGDIQRPNRTPLQSTRGPIDGGWGWVVVFASFMAQVILGGITFSFGVLLGEFVDFFGTSHATTSLTSSLITFVGLGSGPIVGALTNLFNCRVVAISGSLIASVGLLISIWAPNIYFLYVSFSMVGGFGLGACYTSSVVVVSFYFEKKRSLATGIATCGIGFGTFVFGPLTEFMLNYFGSWKSVFLIESAITLNCVICGALYRPINEHQVCCDDLEEDVCNDDESKSQIVHQKTPSSLSLPQFPVQKDTLNKHLLIKLHSSKEYASDFALHGSPKKKPGAETSYSHNNITDDAYYIEVSSTEHPQQYARRILAITEPADQRRKHFPWKEILDVTILKEPVYVIFAISNLLTCMCFYIPYVFLPDRASLIGCTKQQAAFLVSILGISNMAGRLTFGALADRDGVNRLILYNTSIVLSGLATFASSLCINYALLCLCAAGYGFFMGVFGPLVPVVLVDLLGLDKLASSFGLSLLFQGIGSLLGAPLAGWLYDVTQNYDTTFYVTGAVIILSGAMLYPVLLFKHKR